MGRLSPANQKEGASSSSSGAVAANALVQKNTPKYPTAPLRSKPNFFGASTLEEELEEIEIDLTRRCGLRMLQAECKRDTLSGLFASQLVRIPKKIQEMKVREFALKYGGSMSSVLEHERKKVAGLLHNQNRNDENEITGTALKKSATKARSRIHQVASARTLRKQEPKINNIVPSTPVTKPNFSVPGSSVIAKRTPHGGMLCRYAKIIRAMKRLTFFCLQ